LRIALSPRLLIRMRSQVQVLAGPPHQPRRSQRCRQRSGNARCRPGPRWGRTPIPPARPVAPPGPPTPGVRLGGDHAAWSRTQPPTAATRRVRPPRAAACSRAHSAAAATGAPHAGLTRLAAQRSRAAAASPNPARVRHRPPYRPTRDLGSVARPKPPRPSIELLDGPAATRDLHPFLWSRSPGRLDLVPTATA
jgi:hypothetical protein